MTTEPIALEDAAKRAIDGDRDAFDRLVRALQGDVYGLALRILWNREVERTQHRRSSFGTLGMLQCLDRPHRLASVLGEILELSGPDAAGAPGNLRRSVS